jgi:acetyl esterase/lipase
MKHVLLLMLAAATLPAPSAAQQAAAPYRILPPVRLWQGEAPGMRDWAGRSATPVKESISADGEEIINVTDPSYQAYLPDAAHATGTALIIAPGGAFQFLSIRKEGILVADWLARHGIAAFVLKYRLVQREKPDPATRSGIQNIPMSVVSAPAVADGKQSLRLIRAHARDYGIDPHRVGAIGFSAGGHVVSMMALDADALERPDFVAAIYGNPFLRKMPDLPPAAAPGALPPFFLALAQNDMLDGPSFRQFYDALFAAGYRPELHLYIRGNHGFGMKKQGSTSDHFIEECFWWLEAQGLTSHANK